MKGMPGTSKTYSAEQLELDTRIQFFKGKNKIREWLLDESPRKKILFLDEFNIEEDGAWDFLKGDPIYFEGEWFKRTDDHIVMGAANLETFPQRTHHQFFQNYAETIYFTEHTHDYLKQQILGPLLAPHQLNEFAQYLLNAYHAIAKFNPHYIYTIRDLQNLAQRFICLVKNKSQTEDNKHCFINACVGEFSGNIEYPEQRQKFYDELYRLFGINIQRRLGNEPPLIELKNDISITQQKSYLVDALDQDLMILKMIKEKRQQQSSTNSDSHKKEYFKQLYILQGDPGVGKSSFIRAMLDGKGIPYQSIEVCNIKAGEQINEACEKRRFIIIDELNLSEELENQLIDLLDKKNPDIMIFATQNEGNVIGRKPLAPSLRNRAHFLYMDNYSDGEMELLAAKHHVKPKPFLRAYHRACKDFPDSVNCRTAFTILRKHARNYQLPHTANVT